MKCPHCRVEFHDNPGNIYLGRDVTGAWQFVSRTCPSCMRFVLNLQNGLQAKDPHGFPINAVGKVSEEWLVYPKTALRSPCQKEVPVKFAEDYREACLVILDSPKASAALSRRCLQNLLRDTARVKPGNLADEIQQAIDGGKLPSHLVESVDAIRNIGNFAAHPMKSTNTGEIIPVEPGEAEWNLDILEALFDFYFVQPEMIKQKKTALNQKLKEAGKPQMK